MIGQELKMSRLGIVSAVVIAFLALGQTMLASEAEDTRTALNLAKLLQAARSVISANQDLINDPEVGDKGLTGEVVLAAALETYRKTAEADPMSVDPESREGRLLRAGMEAIREVTDENQSFINRKGVGFKAFIPAVFGRLVTERLAEKIGHVAEIKITAPPHLVRNRKARPDDWEQRVIETKLASPEWPRGQFFAESFQSKGRDAFRVAVPEYYSASCLSCHGEPKGEIDITGYPKEGAEEGDLGGVISITLFHAEE
jgi:hypothetical protein